MISATIATASTPARPLARVDTRAAARHRTARGVVASQKIRGATRANFHPSPASRRLAPRGLRAVESDDTSSQYVVPGRPVNPGLYCDWSVTDADVVEVWAYRVSLSIVALSVLACSSVAFTAGSGPLPGWLNGAYFTGAAGLGSALVLIHMYVTPIKKFMQALYVAGLLGSIGVAALGDGSAVPAYVAAHPVAVWAVGPMFASLTGVAFKEGMCYGKAECAALFAVIPLTLLGHLTGVAGEGTEKGFLATWCVLIAVFAARKYTQEVKDDIGDKSVFIFNDLTEEEQVAWTRRAQQRDPQRFARMMGD